MNYRTFFVNTQKAMEPSRTILIKRRKVGPAGPPDSLNNGELAFNEINRVLYYGLGNDGNGIAEEIIPIAGGFNSLIENASVTTLSNVSASNDYLIININGQQRALRLFDF
jgi:hypothetical protein